MKRWRHHRCMIGTEADGDEPLCECALHDWDTVIREPIEDTNTGAWSQYDPPKPEPEAKPQWRRVAPYVAATALVCGTAAALLRAGRSTIQHVNSGGGHLYFGTAGNRHQQPAPAEAPTVTVSAPLRVGDAPPHPERNTPVTRINVYTRDDLSTTGFARYFRVRASNEPE